MATAAPVKAAALIKSTAVKLETAVGVGVGFQNEKRASQLRFFRQRKPRSNAGARSALRRWRETRGAGLRPCSQILLVLRSRARALFCSLSSFRVRACVVLTYRLQRRGRVDHFVLGFLEDHAHCALPALVSLSALFLVQADPFADLDTTSLANKVSVTPAFRFAGGCALKK